MHRVALILLGSILGGIHTMIAWAAWETLKSIRYFTTMDVNSTFWQIIGIVDAAIILTVISAIWWLPKCRNYLESYLDARLRDNDNDE